MEIVDARRPAPIQPPVDHRRARRTRRDASVHFVYEFWDGEQCLYVGLTSRLGARLDVHNTKPWWPRVTHMSATAHPDRWSGLDAEQARIEELQPLFNFNHTERAVGSRSGLGHGGVRWTSNDA